MTVFHKLVAWVANLLLFFKRDKSDLPIISLPNEKLLDETLHSVILNELIPLGVTLDTNKFLLIGIRNSANQRKDVINDWLGFITSNRVFISKGTTEAGSRFTTDVKVRNPNGTFHLKTGYHRKIWCFGIHKGYDALVNDPKKCLPTEGRRDVNFNFEHDLHDKNVRGHFGINFHRMHPIQIMDKIGGYSAGCQVVNDNKDYQFIYQQAKESGIEIFDYFLIDIDRLPAHFREELCLS